MRRLKDSPGNRACTVGTGVGVAFLPGQFTMNRPTAPVQGGAGSANFSNQKNWIDTQ